MDKRGQGNTYPMRPRRERVELFLRSRVLPHVVTMPSKRKIVIQRIDQQIEQFCKVKGGGKRLSSTNRNALLQLQPSKKEKNVPIWSDSVSHSNNAFATPLTPSEVYHRANTGSPSAGCITCWTPHESG